MLTADVVHGAVKPGAATKGQGPRRAVIRFEVKDARVKWSRVKGRVVPRALVVADRELPFVQQKGVWGVKMPLREMTELVPDFGTEVQRTIAGLAVERVRTLVGAKDAEVFGEAYKRRHSDEASPDDEADAGKGGSTKGRSAAGKSAATATSDEAESALAARLDQGYNQMLDTTSFFFPQVQPGSPQQGPGFGGWELVDSAEGEVVMDENDPEAGAAGGGGEGGNEGQGESAEEDGTWLTTLGAIILVVVALVAPVAAAVWLCTQALTIAAVTTAFLGTVGAVTAASTVAVTFKLADQLLSGNPFVNVFDQTTVWTNPNPDVEYLAGLHEGDTVDSATMQRWLNAGQ